MLRYVVVVDEVIANHDVHHRQGEGGVAGRPDLQVAVGRFRGARPDRIDHDDPGATTLRLEHEGPEVQVRDDRVRSPQYDEPAVDDLLRIDAGAGADRR